MKKSEAVFGLLRVPLDALAVFAALVLSFRLRQLDIDLLPGYQLLEPARTLPTLDYFVNAFVVPSVFVFILFAAFLKLYALRSTMGSWVEIGRVLIVTGLWLVAVIAWYFLVLKQLFFSRALLLHAVFFIAFFDIAIRMTLRILQRSLLRFGIGKLLVVSVGSSALAKHAQATLEQGRFYDYLGHQKTLEALKKLTQKVDPDLVIQTDPNPDSDDTIALINYCRSNHFGYGFLPPVLADVPHQLQVERLGLLPLMRFQPTPLDGWGRVVKRLFDIGVSLVALIVLLPVNILIGLIIVIDSGFPIFYRSTRIGQHGRTKIRVLKFRSMKKDADKEKATLKEMNHRRDGPLFKMKNDPRVTRVGRFLRRWTLDELPQFWNVLLGHMSLVGPRPHLPDEVERYSMDQRRVFAVKPGITGLAQVSGRSDLKFEEEVHLDLQYIEEWSIFLDLWVLWRTVVTVLSRKGAD
jgi:exopolysaccharide biosynthesis polyprenyl glycosylphosphotransferase